jgi:hypothetical protein
VSQSGFIGAFTESDNCSSSVATVTKLSQIGSTAKYQVNGQTALGSCTARFQGFGSSQAAVAIAVQEPGIVINARVAGASH